MGNSHMRNAMIEEVNACIRSQAGHKSKALQARQKGMDSEVVSYADKGSDRIIRKFNKLIRRGLPRASDIYNAFNISYPLSYTKRGSDWVPKYHLKRYENEV